MTDEQRKALVQDYRVYAKMKSFPGPYITAADQIEADGKRIEALSAENERLRYELRCIFRDYQSCMADEWIADVRAALGETK